MTRGVQHQVDLWHTLIQGQFYKQEIEVDGKKINRIVAGALRPIQLWEYVFPEECLNQVLFKLGKNKDSENYWGKGYAKYAVAPLRMALGARPLPKDPKLYQTPTELLGVMPNIKGVAVEIIGIKDDARGEYIDNGERTGVIQEML